MDKHYTLTGRRGIFVAVTDRTTIIGQMDGCDVKIINRTQYEDVIFAKIKPNKDDDGWHLIKATMHYPILVNGVEMNRVHYLQDGDNLEFPNATIRFNILDGKQNEPSVVHIHKNSLITWAILAMLVILAGIFGLQIYHTQRENLTAGMKAEIEASLFTTHVDSIQFVHGDSVIETYSYASSPVGTAFLTTDSLIVTARHCIQPWLNVVSPPDYAKIPSMTDWPIAKALFVETENQLNDNTEYRMVSYLTLTDEAGQSISISSDEFKMNYELDEIVELGSYDTPLYWRSISHRYTRQGMMLGDIAVAKTYKAGNITLAKANEMPEHGSKLFFFGHPESGVNGNKLDCKTDELRLPIHQLEESPDHLFMLAHEGGLTPGFSGGPVIYRNSLGYKAVGVISVIDERNNARSYSVPTSEIKFLK